MKINFLTAFILLALVAISACVKEQSNLNKLQISAQNICLPLLQECADKYCQGMSLSDFGCSLCMGNFNSCLTSNGGQPVTEPEKLEPYIKKTTTTAGPDIITTPSQALEKALEHYQFGPLCKDIKSNQTLFPGDVGANYDEKIPGSWKGYYVEKVFDSFIVKCLMEVTDIKYAGTCVLYMVDVSTKGKVGDQYGGYKYQKNDCNLLQETFITS